MRKRQIKKNIFLNHEENKLLKEKALKKGLSESELIRGFIKGYVPYGAIPDDIKSLIYEIKKIGININQLAEVANRTNKINYTYLINYKKELDKLIFEIKTKLFKDELVEEVI